MKVLKAAHSFIDVFVGEGWSNWSRVQNRLTPQGKRLFHVNGLHLNRFQLKKVKDVVTGTKGG